MFEKVKNLLYGLRWFLITSYSVDLPRTDRVSLFTAKIDRHATSEALDMMRFHLSTFRLILEVFNAFCLVTTNSDTDRGISN